jgi:hypothetical protein
MAAHHAGKVSAEQDAAAAQQEQEAVQAQAVQAQAVQAPAAQQVAAPSAGLGSAGLDELTKLAGLHDQGILSDEEFAAAKARILG